MSEYYRDSRITLWHGDALEETRNLADGSVDCVVTSPPYFGPRDYMPVRLAQRCIAAGCKPGGVVLDPFSGSGTTGMAALGLDRRYVGIDLSRDYLELSLQTRFKDRDQINMFSGEAV